MINTRSIFALQNKEAFLEALNCVVLRLVYLDTVFIAGMIAERSSWDTGVSVEVYMHTPPDTKPGITGVVPPGYVRRGETSKANAVSFGYEYVCADARHCHGGLSSPRLKGKNCNFAACCLVTFNTLKLAEAPCLDDFLEIEL